MYRLISVAALALLMSMCRSNTKPEEEQTFLDGEDLAVDPDSSGPENLPPSLWSPARRQSNASYYFLVAENEILRANLPQARQMYESAYNLDPNPFLAWKVIAAQAAGGQVNEALLQAKKMVLLYPRDAQIHGLYGQLLATSGLYDQAIQHYEKAIDLEPSRIDPYLGLIQLYQFQKKTSEAIVIAQDLVKMDPNYADGWAMLAKLLLSTNQKKSALKPAKRAYEIQSADSEKILIYALALELNGQSKKAVSLYELLYRLNPTNEDLIARMVDLYRKIGDLNDALALLKEVTGHSESPNSGVLMQQAFILWELQRFEEASAILDGLAVRYPESDRLQYLAALGQERLEKYEMALVTYQKIAPTSQYSIHAQYRAVNIYRKLKKVDEAIRLVRAVVQSKAERAQDFYAVGASVLGDENRFKESIALLEEGIKDFPDAVQLVFLLGVYQEKNGDKKACIATMRRVIAKDATHSSAYNYLGYLFAEAGEHLDEAEQLVKKALILKPGDGYYLDSLGWVYFQKKDYVKALDSLNKANLVTPGEGVILEHIGDVYVGMGDKDKARSFYEQAEKGKGEDRDLARIKSKVEKYRAPNG